MKVGLGGGLCLQRFCTFVELEGVEEQVDYGSWSAPVCIRESRGAGAVR